MINATRIIPNTTNPWLQAQVGRMETRPEQVPIYENRRLIGIREGPARVPVFRLVGWGPDLKSAMRMAEAEEKGGSL